MVGHFLRYKFPEATEVDIRINFDMVRALVEKTMSAMLAMKNESEKMVGITDKKSAELKG